VYDSHYAAEALAKVLGSAGRRHDVEVEVEGVSRSLLLVRTGTEPAKGCGCDPIASDMAMAKDLDHMHGTEKTEQVRQRANAAEMRVLEKRRASDFGAGTKVQEMLLEHTVDSSRVVQEMVLVNTPDNLSAAQERPLGNTDHSLLVVQAMQHVSIVHSL
jgi:hypothetical protein